MWNDGVDPDTNATLLSDASYNFITNEQRMFTFGDGTVGKYTKGWKEHDTVHVSLYFGHGISTM